MNEDIQQALDILRQGGVILYPTDTIWGIGCDATNSEAVKKIYKIKQREDSKSMLVLIDNPNRLTQYVVEIPDMAWEIIDLETNPLTIIYPEAKNLADNLTSDDKSIGIRIVHDEFCQNLIKRFNKPVVSTSANISGMTAPILFNEIDEKILYAVDYIVKWRQNDQTHRKPSGIIKLGINGEVKVIRE